MSPTGLVKGAKSPLVRCFGIVAKRPGHRRERERIPRNLIRPKEPDLQALDPRRDLGLREVRPIEELHQADSGNRVDREQRVDHDLGAGFLLGLPAGAVRGIFVQLQEARRQGPKACLRLDCPAAEEDAPLPRRDRAHDNLRVFVTDKAARVADQARPVVALRHPARDRAAAVRIAPHDGPSMKRALAASPAGRQPAGESRDRVRPTTKRHDVVIGRYRKPRLMLCPVCLA